MRCCQVCRKCHDAITKPYIDAAEAANLGVEHCANSHADLIEKYRAALERVASGGHSWAQSIAEEALK
jgi:hypothetical protein